jgi:hypothetical protein
MGRSAIMIIRDANNQLTGAEVCKRKQTPDGAVLQVQIGPGDPVSNIPVVIDLEHHHIHEGETYEWYYYNATLNGTVDFRLVVPVYENKIKCPHLLIEIICSDTSVTLIQENPIINAPGSESTSIMNRNRNSTNVAGLKIYTSSSYTGIGVEIAHYITFSTKTVSNTGSRAIAEWILKSGTEYLIRCTTSGSCVYSLKLHWYEDLGV